MAQVTGAISSKDYSIEISTNGSSWTAVSGAVTTITPSGGGKTTGETYTFEGDDPLVTVGKNQPFELAMTAVYTEGASDLFETARPVYENGSDFYVRWSPKGGQSTEFMFTTGAGKITNLTYPGGDAGNGGPIMTGLTWRGKKPTKSVVA
jgi:hypothetical protein